MNSQVTQEPLRCVACNTTIDELSSTKPEHRVPCPKCGSTARLISLSATSTISLTSETSARVVPHHDLLIEEAHSLLSAGKHSLAVLVAHMACEVATSRVIDAAFGRSSFPHMAEAMLAFLNGYSLANPRIREFYASLTGDDVTRLPYWAKFQESARRRNDVAHTGRILKQQESQESLTATASFVLHMNEVLRKLQAD
ncbi:zinc ribbon domain-containing protein [Bordetella sputigena]|uniref:zinc ribbon domain-containing protein n=1 Tax=Bordetella sputigena TaxID=1416810 RepID=UPI0039F0D677